MGFEMEVTVQAIAKEHGKDNSQKRLPRANRRPGKRPGQAKTKAHVPPKQSLNEAPPQADTFELILKGFGLGHLKLESFEASEHTFTSYRVVTHRPGQYPCVRQRFYVGNASQMRQPLESEWVSKTPTRQEVVTKQWSAECVIACDGTFWVSKLGDANHAYGQHLRVARIWVSQTCLPQMLQRTLEELLG